MVKKTVKSDYFHRYSRHFPLLLFTFSILLYANTLTHQYTQDDAIAIYNNDFTTKGISGLVDIFSKDSFHGFFGEKKGLLSGGRYRPLTLAFFALLWELFGNNPFVGHLFNIIFYGGLTILVYHFLILLKPWKLERKNKFWAFIGAVIFCAHPIHTEVVANIKGLDEIWSLGFGLLASIYAFKFIDEQKRSSIILSALFLVLAILSKENAIVFLGIIPLSLWFFRKKVIRSSLFLFFIFGICTATYLIIRFSIVGMPGGDPPLEMMNNPFIKLENGVYYPFSPSEKWATIAYGLGKYVQLLFFPHPLTHDYYPRHFEVMHFSNPSVLLALIMNIMIGLFAIIDVQKKTVISYVSFFYLGSIALTSNILFPIGTHLSERFLFTPSLAFAILISYLIAKFYRKIHKSITVCLFALVIILFSVKTISRNKVWKSDYKLFTTDVHISSNSAKMRNAAGGAMLTQANETENLQIKKNLQTEAKSHLLKATDIHPNYKNAHLLLGNAHFGLDEYDLAILSYERALKIDPGYRIAEQNLSLTYREAGRYEGSINGNISKAIQYLFKADVLDPGSYETISLLGIAHGNAGKHHEAIAYFKKALDFQPQNARANLNLSNAYINLGDNEKGAYYFDKAKDLDPSIK